MHSFGAGPPRIARRVKYTTLPPGGRKDHLYLFTQKEVPGKINLTTHLIMFYVATSEQSN